MLIHGSDVGLVAERAAALAAAVTAGSSDPFALVRLDPSEIAAEPGRLADEAGTIGLFGGARAIRVRVRRQPPDLSRRRGGAEAEPPVDAWVILEAGDISAREPGCASSARARPGAASIACYADSDAALDQLIDRRWQRPGARHRRRSASACCAASLGADRLRQPIGSAQARALCARGRPGRCGAAVRAIVEDTGAVAVDEAVDAMAAGEIAELDRSLRRLIGGERPPSSSPRPRSAICS